MEKQLISEHFRNKQNIPSVDIIIKQKVKQIIDEIEISIDKGYKNTYMDFEMKDLKYSTAYKLINYITENYDLKIYHGYVNSNGNVCFTVDWGE